LLLMMLALYDADGNLLQKQSGQIRQAELYEQLLDKFVRREIAKLSPGLSEEELQQAVTLELTQLAIAALAMFNRGRQYATEEELDADLEFWLETFHALNPVAYLGGAAYRLHDSS
jgi:hypothetical protein